MIDSTGNNIDVQRDEQIVRSFNESDSRRVEESARAKFPGTQNESFETTELQFEKLSLENLQEAKVLVDRIFALEKGAASQNLESIITGKSEVPSEEIPYFNQNYWVAKDRSGKIVGITGTYELLHDRADHCWLGWFALQPELRGQKIGTKLLDFTVREVAAQKKTDLYIAASDHPDMAGNAKFYHQNDCPIVAVLNSSGNHIGNGARELSQPVIRGVRGHYQEFIDAGFNMMIRRKRLGGSAQ